MSKLIQRHTEKEFAWTPRRTQIENTEQESKRANFSSGEEIEKIDLFQKLRQGIDLEGTQ